MAHKQEDKLKENGPRLIKQTSPEVLPRAKRRTFTAEYKLWVVEEADKCREQPGQIGALLRREGLYSSHQVFQFSDQSYKNHLILVR